MVECNEEPIWWPDSLANTAVRYTSFAFEQRAQENRKVRDGNAVSFRLAAGSSKQFAQLGDEQPLEERQRQSHRRLTVDMCAERPAGPSTTRAHACVAEKDLSKEEINGRGRIENCQIGVFLGNASAKGHALVDRELYLPKEWARDTSRRKAAGVPKGIDFATKIALARRMIERAVAAGLPAKWVTADSVYGSEFRFRTTLESLGLGYVVAVRSDFAVAAGLQYRRAKQWLELVPADAWHRVSCGAGSKGPRVFEWALMRTNAPEPERSTRWLFFRRNLADVSDVAFFACGAPPVTTFEQLVEVAGKRWTIEECFETAKGDCGLDEYEVRSWTGWHRHVTLAMWAFAVVSAVRSQTISARARPSRSPSRPRKKGARHWFG